MSIDRVGDLETAGVEALNARIVQWQPIAEARAERGRWLILARAGTWWCAPAFWQGHAHGGYWCQGEGRRLNFVPTHFCELPEGP